MLTKAYAAHTGARMTRGRVCECCDRLDHGRAKIARRQQRRREAAAWKRETARGE